VPTAAIRTLGLAASLGLVLVLALVVLAPATPLRAADRPQLRIERWQPTTVAGVGFHARAGSHARLARRPLPECPPS
jgi:hypothetical protein